MLSPVVPFLLPHWRRKPIQFLTAIFLPLIALTCGVLWWWGHEIAAPRRRALQDYHKEFLQNPAAHGVTLQRFRLDDGTPALLLEPLPGGQLGTRGLKIREQLRPEFPPGDVLATLVLVHGRGGRKEDGLLIAERFCAVGFRCLLPDMPAHGEHPARAATYGLREANLPGRVLTAASQQFQFSRHPAALFGISMGGSVVMHAATEPEENWTAVVVISSFDRLDATLEENLRARSGPLAVPLQRSVLSWVYRADTGIDLAEIRPDLRSAELTIPILVAHGTADQIIPIQAGRRLFEAVPASVPKTWIEVPGAGHDHVLVTDFPLYATVAEWLLRCTAQENGN